MLYAAYETHHTAMAPWRAAARSLADTLLEQVDEAGVAVFPPGGTRVLAFPARSFAIADGKQDYAFAYLNLRMARGRSEATQQRIGTALLATAKEFFDPIQTRRLVGVTLQIDIGNEVFDGKLNNIHPLFKKD